MKNKMIFDLNTNESTPHKRAFFHAPRTIRSSIIFSYSVVSLVLLVTVTIMLSTIFNSRTRAMTIEAVQQANAQTVVNIEDYLKSMRSISDTMYYNVIKSKDIAIDSIEDDMDLLYAAGNGNLVSIALYKEDGTLVAASPINTEKENIKVTKQSWFKDAMEQAENMHFSMPHVQNLFDDPSYNYQWVISLSRAVEITENGHSQKGVLLVDMNYESIEHLLDEANNHNSARYTYLCTETGELIDHPRQNQINAGLVKENNNKITNYTSNVTSETFEGEKRFNVISPVAYTGWKLVSVIPDKAMRISSDSTKYLLVMVVSLTAAALLLVTQYIANRIARPINNLNDAIANSEGIKNIPNTIYQDSTVEVKILGQTLHAYINQIDRLMNAVVQEEEEKRKTELDALQGQINPHFLYNTLDSIVWMIEGEKNQEAVYMVTQLAQLFRISLNRGKTMISIEQELKHAKAYLNIQKIRYKDAFEAIYDIEEGVEDYIIIKIVIQPILENAIYHGIKEAEEDGIIRIHAYRRDDDIYIEVSDNGYGMNEEECKALLQGDEKPITSKHGSGVGLINVHRRLKLRFGEQYGLHIKSEPDVGTTVTIHIPAIKCTLANLSALENSTYNKENTKNESTDK